MKNFTTISFFVAWLSAGFSLAFAVPPPNVLFIVSDDMNCSLGYYGSAVVKSPNIDRLAARGVRFDRAYANYPVCNASRTSFLSGRRPDTTQVFANGVDSRIKLGPQFEFLPEYFHSHGYYTAGVGKIQHTPEQIATIKYDSYEDPGAVSENEKKDRKKNGISDAAKAKKQAQRDLPDEQEPDGIIAHRAVKILEQPHDKPLFLAVGFHRPHGPRAAPQKYFDLYPPETLPPLVEPAGHAAGIPEIAHPPKYNPDWSEKKWRTEWQTYYACATFMDAQVGVVLDAMDRLKLWDNTIVIFFGDHGVHLGEHGGFLGKQSLMEESVRVPLVVSAPGRKPGTASARVVELVDVFPTLTDLCGLPTQPGVEGRSFAPLLDDPRQPWKESAFSVARRGKTALGRSLRSEQFTFIEWPDSSMQLYDHERDPKEYFNLARDTTFAETLAGLKRLLAAGPRAASTKEEGIRIRNLRTACR